MQFYLLMHKYKFMIMDIFPFKHQPQQYHNLL